MALTWVKTKITIDGRKQEAVCPMIISASRSTDIPAFHSEWFMNRLKAGYVKWLNPFNQQPQYVSFEKARVIVFWTKNAEPMMKYLDDMDKTGINYYFTFTINDYKEEVLEPNVPSLERRIKTFRELSQRLGKGRVIWRFDPLILSDKLSIDKLIDKIEKVGNKLYKHTEKLVISFADIDIYKKVISNLKQAKETYKEFTAADAEKLAEGLGKLSKNWGLTIATCAEKFDLCKYGIEHNRCIDDVLMVKEFSGDSQLMKFLGYEEDLFNTGKNTDPKKLKDKGQRKECGCIMSKDIGMYNTCGHLCLYCYANHSQKTVESNLKKADKQKDSIV